MNFELNDDQQAYIASAKAFSDKELAPHAAHWDAESVFAKDALKAAGELGFMGMYTPEAAGGLGMGHLNARSIHFGMDYPCFFVNIKCFLIL